MVEFALILFPLLILVAGIIQFGIALNYWLDMQRIANQGARWAAVNNWPPDCPVGTAAAHPPATPLSAERRSRTPLELPGDRSRACENSIASRSAIPDGGTPRRSDPVRVRLEAPFTFLPILGSERSSSRRTRRCASSSQEPPTLIIAATSLCHV